MSGIRLGEVPLSPGRIGGYCAPLGVEADRAGKGSRTVDIASPALIALVVPSTTRPTRAHESPPSSPPSREPTRKGFARRGAMVVATMALLVTACSGGAGTAATPSTTPAAPAMHLVNGTVSIFTGGGGCSLVTRTIGEGTEVVVYARDLSTLATTRLGTGSSGRLDAQECNFPFKATVPTTSSYLLSIGDQLNLAVTKAGLKRSKWSLTINSPNIL